MTILDVHIGEVKIAKRGEVLQAILGSCIGVGLIWRERKVCGLAHCLLPECPTTTHQIGAKYVDQAVRSLKALMRIKLIDVQAIDAIVVGGGNMTASDVTDPERLVGSNNYEVALREIQNLRVRLLHCDGGGNAGRKLIVDSGSLTYLVKSIPRIGNLETIE